MTKKSSVEKGERATKAPQRRTRGPDRKPRLHRSREELALAFHGQAYDLSQKGRFDEAVSLLWKAIKYCPVLPCCWCNLGVDLDHLGQEDEAYAAMRTAADLLMTYDRSALDADHGLMLTVVGEGIAARDPERALKLQRLAAELSPEEPIVQGNLAASLLTLDLAEEALPYARKAFALAPDDSSYAGLLMAAMYGADLIFDSIAFGEDCVKRWPRDEDLRFNLAIRYLDHGQEQRAAEIFSEQLREHPDDACAHGLAGVGFASIGWASDARQAQAEAKRLGGGRPEVDNLIEEIDELLGDDNGREDDQPGDAMRLALACAAAARSLRRLGWGQR